MKSLLVPAAIAVILLSAAARPAQAGWHGGRGYYGGWHGSYYRGWHGFRGWGPRFFPPPVIFAPPPPVFYVPPWVYYYPRPYYYGQPLYR
jgi:hypothetical protein